MSIQERINNWKVHPTMRGQFGFELYKAMAKNENVILLTGDLGYGLFDAHREDFPDRFINTGAAEQSMLDIACGLAMSGKTPVCYSITPFLLYRPFETIRTYINHERLNVKLVGSGRDNDYKHDGYSHFAGDDKEILKTVPNVFPVWPVNKEQIPFWVKYMLQDTDPWYLNLVR